MSSRVHRNLTDTPGGWQPSFEKTKSRTTGPAFSHTTLRTQRQRNHGIRSTDLRVVTITGDTPYETALDELLSAGGARASVELRARVSSEPRSRPCDRRSEHHPALQLRSAFIVVRRGRGWYPWLCPMKPHIQIVAALHIALGALSVIGAIVLFACLGLAGTIVVSQGEHAAAAHSGLGPGRSRRSREIGGTSRRGH